MLFFQLALLLLPGAPLDVPTTSISRSRIEQGELRLESWIARSGALGRESPRLEAADWAPGPSLAVGGPPGFSGEAWYRARLDVAPDLVGERIGLWIRHNGALELFVDGERIAARGDTDAVMRGDGPSPARMAGLEPVFFEPRRAGVHEVVVGYAVLDSALLAWLWEPVGFDVEVGLLDSALGRRLREARVVDITIFAFLGVMLGFALLHVFLYLLDRESRIHLHFALLALSMAGISVLSWSLKLTSTTSQLLATQAVFRAFIVAAALLFLHFTYEVTQQAKGWRYRIFLGVGAAIALGAYYVPTIGVFAFILPTMIDDTYLLLRVLRQRSKEIWILGAGVILAAVTSTIQMTRDMFVPYEYELIYLVGFTGFIAAGSLYVARRFAATRSELKRQLLKRLEQERIAQQEARRRERIEADNERRLVELEELRKREQVMQELEVAHRDLDEAQAQLIQSAELAVVGRLVAGVAHELNSPLGAIGCAAQSLNAGERKLRAALEPVSEAGPLSKVMHVLDDAGRVIEDGTKRITSLVDRLRRFARLDEATLQVVRVDDCVDDAIGLMKAGLPPGVDIVREQGEILRSPAIPTSSTRSSFTCSRTPFRPWGWGKDPGRDSHADGYVRIEVEDDGCGIAPSDLGHVFEPGFTTRCNGVGMGLGLPICRQSAEAHGGRIELKSELGRGTKVTLFLSDHLGQPPKAAARSAHARA